MSAAVEHLANAIDIHSRLLEAQALWLFLLTIGVAVCLWQTTRKGNLS